MPPLLAALPYIMFAISVGVTIAGILLAPKSKDPNSTVFNPTTLATRGDYISYIIGTRRIGHVFCWAGDRQTKKNQTGGGSSFGGGGGPTSVVYSESGWHVLCVGPATRLISIFANGIQIWGDGLNGNVGGIHSSVTSSGTSFEVKGIGSFSIFWGEQGQPINTFLGSPSRVGINSEWPCVCYVVWKNFQLGPTPIWPILEYVVEVLNNGNGLLDSDYFLTGSSTGINPAHALVQVLTSNFPYGLNIDGSYVDATSIETLGALLETEHLPMNILVAPGSAAASLIDSILADSGAVMTQVLGSLRFFAQRAPTGPIPELTNDVISPNDIEFTINRGDLPINRLVFTFQDQSFWTFSQRDVPVDDDGDQSDLGGVSTSKISLDTITSLEIAAKVIRRRMQEAKSRTSLTIKARYGAREVYSGMLLYRAGIGNLRVIDNLFVDESPECTLTCSPDVYGLPDNADTLDIAGGQGGISPTYNPVADIAFQPYELPREVTDKVSLSVLRVRANSGISGAYIYMSSDLAVGSLTRPDSTFTNIGEEDSYAVGGLLTANIGSSGADIITSNPTFEDQNGDAAFVLDLTDDDSGWQAGRQICVISGETFFLQSVTIVAHAIWLPSTAYTLGQYVIPSVSNGFRYKVTTAGTTSSSEPHWPLVKGNTVTNGGVVFTAHYFEYQLNNLIRARFGTSRQSHSVNDQIYIADVNTLASFANKGISVGAKVYIKSIPFTTKGQVDIASVAFKAITIAGLVATPLPVGNLRVDKSGNFRKTSSGDLRESIT